MKLKILITAIAILSFGVSDTFAQKKKGVEPATRALTPTDRPATQSAAVASTQSTKAKGFKASADLAGTWIVQMDNDKEAGAFKNREIANVTFKKDKDGSYYFVVNKLKNKYSVRPCKNCKGELKDKRLADGKTKWGSGFKFDNKSKSFTSGSLTEAKSGKERKGLNIVMIDNNNLILHGTYTKGNRKGQKREFKLKRAK